MLPNQKYIPARRNLSLLIEALILCLFEEITFLQFIISYLKKITNYVLKCTMDYLTQWLHFFLIKKSALLFCGIWIVYFQLGGNLSHQDVNLKRLTCISQHLTATCFSKITSMIPRWYRGQHLTSHADSCHAVSYSYWNFI